MKPDIDALNALQEQADGHQHTDEWRAEVAQRILEMLMGMPDEYRPFRAEHPIRIGDGVRLREHPDLGSPLGIVMQWSNDLVLVALSSNDEPEAWLRFHPDMLDLYIPKVRRTTTHDDLVRARRLPR